MSLDFLTVSIIVVFVSLFLEFFHVKFLKMCHGIDLLFFAPWLVAIKFGFSNAMALGFIVMSIHVIFNLHMARFVLLALPALLIAIILGTTLGIAGFYTTLMSYMIVSSVTTTAFGGLGGRFILFLMVGSVFNVGLFSLSQGLVL